MFEFLFISYEIFSTAQAPILQDFHFAFSLFNLGFFLLYEVWIWRKNGVKSLPDLGAWEHCKIKQTTLVYTRLFKCSSNFQGLGFLVCPAVTVSVVGGWLNVQITHLPNVMA